MSTILELSEIHTFYGKSHILHGVSLCVREGEVVALLGRNGAGKTTTLRSIMGLTPCRRGSVELFSRDVTKWPPYRIARTGVGYVPEGRRIFNQLTVNDNLRVPKVALGPWTVQRLYELFPRLAERKTSKAGRLSGGEKEMLAIARVLLLNPRLLILDEPSQGLAPLIVDQVMHTIREMRSEGMSVLLVEQNAWLALQDADRAYILGDGKVTYNGAARELSQDKALVHALAGATAKGVRTAALSTRDTTTS